METYAAIGAAALVVFGIALAILIIIQRRSADAARAEVRASIAEEKASVTKKQAEIMLEDTDEKTVTDRLRRHEF